MRLCCVLFRDAEQVGHALLPDAEQAASGLQLPGALQLASETQWEGEGRSIVLLDCCALSVAEGRAAHEL